MTINSPQPLEAQALQSGSDAPSFGSGPGQALNQSVTNQWVLHSSGFKGCQVVKIYLRLFFFKSATAISDVMGQWKLFKQRSDGSGQCVFLVDFGIILIILIVLPCYHLSGYRVIVVVPHSATNAGCCMFLQIWSNQICQHESWVFFGVFDSVI